MVQRKIVMFDFDGVIVDSFEMAFGITQQLRLGLDREQYRDMFMGNIYDSVEKMDGKNTERNWNATKDEWFGIYAPLLLELPVIAGVKEALAALAKQYALVVVTSSINSPVHAYLELHDLHHHFEEVLGADVHVSKVKKIQMVLDKYGARPEDCVFITDTVGDLLEAQHKGIAALVVTWGFHSLERFAAHPPAGFIERPEQMLEKFNGFFAA